jgi:hypothetical protein
MHENAVAVMAMAVAVFVDDGLEQGGGHSQTVIMTVKTRLTASRGTTTGPASAEVAARRMRGRILAKERICGSKGV